MASTSKSSSSKLANPFIPHGIARELSPEHLAEIPGGNVETYLNLRSMWRRRPDQPISSKAYAEAFRKGRNTVTKLLKLIAKHHGAEITEVRNKYGMHDGHLITVLPGEHGLNQDVAVNGHEMHPKCTQNAPKSPPAVTAPCSAGSSPCSQESMDRASLVHHRASVGAPLDSSLDNQVDTRRNKELGRTAVAVAPPIDRSQGLQAGRAAFNLYQSVQHRLGGVLSDSTSRETIKQAIVGMTDDQVQSASAIALHNAFSRYWVYGRSASHCAGNAIHAALQGKLTELTGGADCSPDAGELPAWDGSQWIDPELQQTLQESIDDALTTATETPAALDKEVHQTTEQDASEAITEPSQSDADANGTGFLVNSFLASPMEQPQPPQVKERLRATETSEERHSRLLAENKRKAALLQPSGSPNRYGLPA